MVYRVVRFVFFVRNVVARVAFGDGSCFRGVGFGFVFLGSSFCFFRFICVGVGRASSFVILNLFFGGFFSVFCFFRVYEIMRMGRFGSGTFGLGVKIYKKDKKKKRLVLCRVLVSRGFCGYRYE